MRKNSDSGFRVGYGRPPNEHQFRPGQSGNPTGRPKGARSFKSDLRDELDALVSISDGNATVEVTKQRAIIKTLLRLAIAGDPRAIATIISSCARAFIEENGDESESAEDRAIMDAVGARPRKHRDGTSGETPSSRNKESQ
jgi:Family of unknown function (DUF5681)